MTYPYVEVIWYDHNGSSGWESAEDYLRTAKPDKCISRGWLIKKSRKYIILASSIMENDSSIGGKEVIIKSCIDEIRELKVTRKST